MQSQDGCEEYHLLYTPQGPSQEEWKPKALEWDAPSISQNQVCVVKTSYHRLRLCPRGGKMLVGGAALAGPAELWRYLALITFLSWESRRSKEWDEKLREQSEFHSDQFCCRSVNVVLRCSERRLDAWVSVVCDCLYLCVTAHRCWVLECYKLIFLQYRSSFPGVCLIWTGQLAAVAFLTAWVNLILISHFTLKSEFKCENIFVI